MQAHEWVKPELARHAVTVMTALFLGFLCAYVVLRARERRRPALPRWNGPISVAWTITVLCAVLLMAFTFAGVVLQRPFTVAEIDEEPDGAESARHSLGSGVLQASVIVFPGIVFLSWVGLIREARRRDSGPASHSLLALLGLALSAAGLLLVLLNWGPAIHRQ